MKIEQQRVGTVDVLMPMGALVDEDASKFNKLLLERLQSPNPRVVVSLEEVPYLDSTALEGLLDASDSLAERATTLRLADLTANCREVLELTGLSHRFRFFNSVHDAVKSFL